MAWWVTPGVGVVSRYLIQGWHMTGCFCAVKGRGELQSFQYSCATSDIVVVEGMQQEPTVDVVLSATDLVPTLVAFGCAPRLQAAMRLGGIRVADHG